MWRKGNPCALLVRMLTDATAVENHKKVSQKIKTRITMWSSNSTSGYLQEGNENTNSKRYLYSYVHCSIIYNSQDMETI